MPLQQRITQFHLDTIVEIYDASMNPYKWESVLDRFVQSAGALGAGLFVVDPSTNEFQLSATSSVFTPELLQEYAQEHHDDEQHIYEHLKKHPARKLLTDREVLNGVVDDYESMPGMEFLRKRIGARHRAAARLHDLGVWLDVIVAQFGEIEGVFGATHLSSADVLVPHVAKSIEIGRTFAVLRSRFNAVLGALDRLHLGVLVLATDGSVIVQNKEAHRIVECSDGVTIDHFGRPRCVSHADNLRLQQGLAEVTRTASALDRAESVLIAASRRSGGSPYLLELSPFVDSGAEFEKKFHGTFLLIVDPDHKHHVSTRGIRELYGLTEAESAVCRLVAEGRTTSEMSDIRNASPETVRSQIKQVLSKTSTASRSQLVRLALMVNLPIDEE